MRKSLLALAAFSMFTAVAGPQDDAQYQTWMKSLQPQLRAIRQAADNAAAKEDAAKVADTFERVAAFWKERHSEEAVTLAEKARDAAKAIADGSGDKAANVQTIMSTCMPCHNAHREGAPPNFKIK